MLNRDSKMGILFFKSMPRDIRGVIAGYLSAEDLKRLKAVSQEFHGPFKRLKPPMKARFEHPYSLEWPVKVIDTLFYPAFRLLDKSYEAMQSYDATSTSRTIKYGAAGAGVFCLMAPIVSVPGIIGIPGAALAGAIYDKIEPKIKEHEINRNIRPFKGQQISFRPHTNFRR